MKAAFYTLGCKVNQYETQIMEQKLAAAGFEIVEPDLSADVYIVNSCTVTAESDRKTRQMLRRFKRLNPSAVTVLCGCFPQSSPRKAASLEEADIVTGVRGRGDIAGLVLRALQDGKRLVDISPFEQAEPFEKMSARGFAEHTRAFVKIQDGCRSFCSYCIIPYSRGPLRSKSLSDLRRELSGLAEHGYREAVLVGINLSAYGSDLGTENIGLADAIETANKADGLDRVRLGSLEPNIITDEFIARAEKCENFCPHFHLSLQSGCEATLRRMNRHYTPQVFLDAVKRLRVAFPSCGITTDVIVGFPGETQAEFAQSLDFVKEIGFSHVHVFPYSRREGTRAAKMPGQIEKAEKERRCRTMIEACEGPRETFMRALVGSTQPVLFEERREGGVFGGFTPNYIFTRVHSGQNLHDKILKVRIAGFDAEGCFGEIECGS